MLTFYNSLTRRKEKFKPVRKGVVHLYACGPTVYDFQHLGNFRTYIFNDVLRRILEYNGYLVKEIINITDVGHLTSDADTGEDKVQAAARAKRKTAWEIARFYGREFKKDVGKLNIKSPTIWARATAHIKEQIELIKKLEKNGYTYLISGDGLYFDSSKFKHYGKLMPSRLKGLKARARVKVVKGKRQPTDFALWKLSPQGVKRDMEWRSPWGKGFPGWHIECSAMSMKYLGEGRRTIDIHTGGIEHIPIHHTNEIAQSEAVTGKKFVNYWLHAEHLLVERRKMAKSLGNFYTLGDLEKKGFNLLSFRYFVLNAHYRSKLNFTWKGIEAAERGLDALYHEIARLNLEADLQIPNLQPQDLQIVAYKDAFFEAVNDDLNIPKALAIVWDLLRDKKIWSSNKERLLFEFDQILGLRLKEAVGLARPPLKISKLVKEREKYRDNKQFVQADRLRKEIESLGYRVEDTPQGPFIWPRLRSPKL